MTQPTSPEVSPPEVPSPAGTILTPAQQAWYDAVDAVATMAKAKLPPACASRIDRARELVRAGHVELLSDGTAKVTSQTDGVTTYLVVNGTCSCEDFPRAPEGLCKHRAGHRIARRAIQMAMQGNAEPPPPPVPSNGTPAPIEPRRPNGTEPRVTPSSDPVAVAQAEAERNCRAAVEATPAPYRGFLMFLPHQKKVGEIRGQPLYAEVRSPYFTVDGRVKMALDEHRAHGGTFELQTAFEVEPHSGQLVCRATVRSTLLGQFTATARVFLGARTGVNASNPLENGETSAVGRVLGFMGYGLVGSGIASAEEVQLAQAMRPVAPDDALAAETAAAGPPRPSGKPPTAKQQALLQDLLRETGMPEEAIAGQLAPITTSREASTRIDQLRSQLRPRDA
jgi:hypothetical protein